MAERKHGRAGTAFWRPSRPGFTHLFAFTRWQHGAIIGAALVATIVTVALKTALAVVMGKIFEIVSAFGNGNLAAEEALSGISTWCLVLCAMGWGVMISSAAFLVSWVIFGELQAKGARDTVFNALLKKDMAWYDTQDDGVTSLHIRIETYVAKIPAYVLS